MSIKSKVFAAAAALTMVGGVGTAGALTAGTANAATPPCGATCINIFSSAFGSFTGPNFVVDVFKQKAVVGQPIIEFRASPSDPAEDFQLSEQGLVSDFYTAGLVSADVALHYGGLGTDPATGTKFPDDVAIEIEYMPYGVSTGLCIGVGSAATNETKVTLQDCGVSSKTVWVEDSLDTSPFTAGIPLINASTTNFSHPAVLTYPESGYPTDNPRPQLLTQDLTGYSGTNGVPVLGSVSDMQLWEAVQGVLP